MVRRRWMGVAALAAAGVAAVMVAVNPLERDKRAAGAADGALMAEGWRVRLAGAAVAERVSAREYQANLEEYADRDALDSDPYLTELVDSVAAPLVAAARDLYPQTRDWAWEWHLAESEEVNAWCLPGGRMMVLSGLLSEEILDDDRDRLATVMAHEVAHALLQHSRETMGRAWVAQGLAWTMAKSLKIGALRESQMVGTLKTALLDPHSRARETEADVLGLELMTRAGFAPAKAVETWERMSERLDPEARTALVQRAMAFLSDHPSDSERLARMKALQPKTRPLAAKARHWDWLVHGTDDAQIDALQRAAAAFGLDSMTDGRSGELVAVAASAEGLNGRQAASEVEEALSNSSLRQGGVLQMGLSALLRGAGGWERLRRIEQAWSKLPHRTPLLHDSGQIADLDLSEEDRDHAAAAVDRVRAYLKSPYFQRRLWRDAAEELGKTRPKARQAILQRLSALSLGSERPA